METEEGPANSNEKHLVIFLQGPQASHLGKQLGGEMEKKTLPVLLDGLYSKDST